MALKEDAPDPNLFTGSYISAGEVATRMREIIKRQPLALSMRDIDRMHLETGCIPMSELDNHFPRITRPHIQNLIKNVMVGRNVGFAFDHSAHIVEVSQRGVDRPAAAALVSTDLYGGLWGMFESNDTMRPQVLVNAYGMEVSPSGKVNQQVLELLASRVIDYAHEVGAALFPHFATVGMRECLPSVYLGAAHSALPTILAADFHNRLSVLLRSLNTVVIASTDMGTNFPEKIIEVESALQTLRDQHPEHALVKGMEHAKAWDILSSRRVNQGGDSEIYKNMQKAALVVYKFFTSMMAGIEASSSQLHPPAGASASDKPEIERYKDGSVNIVIKEGYYRSSVQFTPQGLDNPVTRFDPDYPQQLTSDLAGALCKEVIGGQWWQDQMSSTS